MSESETADDATAAQDDNNDDAERLGAFLETPRCPTHGNYLTTHHDDDGMPVAECGRDDCEFVAGADELIEMGAYEEREYLDESETDDDDDDSDTSRRDAKTLEDLLHAPNSEWHNDRDLMFSRKQAQVVMYAIDNPDASLSDFDNDADLPSSQYARDVLYRADPDAGAEDAAQLALARHDAEDADDPDEDAIEELKADAKALRDAHNANRHASDDDDDAGDDDAQDDDDGNDDDTDDADASDDDANDDDE